MYTLTALPFLSWATSVLLPCYPDVNPGLCLIYFDPHKVENIVLPKFAEEYWGNLLNYLRSSRLLVSNLGSEQWSQDSY